MTKFIELTGKKFGKLTVLERVENDKKGSTRWKCKCDCGNEIVVKGRYLREGDTKSCGCLTNHPNVINLVGQKFNRWTVIRRVKSAKSNYILWECICECGEKRALPGYTLRKGRSKSCGCLARENVKKRNHKKHGCSNTKIYNTWRNMIDRCSNPKDHNFNNYGGRGIKVCDRWLKFENFYIDMIESYMKHIEKYGEKDTSIDRMNVNGDYTLSNCRWATPKEQAANRRSNHLITYKGQTKTLAEWSEKFNMLGSTINERLRRGWPIEKALETPPEEHYIQYVYNGESKTMSEWASIYNLPYDIVKARLNQYHWPIEEVLNTPIGESKRRNRMITYKSMTKSLPEWAEEYNIPCRTLWRRLFELNWSFEKALTTPIRKINKANSKHS